MRFTLFVDYEVELSYHFSNGTIITTDPDYEYSHEIYVEVPDGVIVTEITYVSSTGKMCRLSPEGEDVFRSSEEGWAPIRSYTFDELIHHRI